MPDLTPAPALPPTPSEADPSTDADQCHDAVTRLLLASGRGDVAAFEALFVTMTPRLVGLAQRLVRERALAEEVTQEAMLSIWLSSAGFDPKRGNATSWMFTITHRRAVEKIQSTEASVRRDHRYAVTQVDVPFDSTADTALEAVNSTQVRRLVTRLGERHRTAVELAFLGGLSHREIADSLGLPLGTAKGQVRDGLRGLRRLVEAEAV